MTIMNTFIAIISLFGAAFSAEVGECNEYHNLGPLTLEDGKEVATLTPKKYFEIEFDIKFNSLCHNPSGNWGYDAVCSVLQIGGKNSLHGERYPLLFVANPSSGSSENYWYTRLTTGFSSDGCCGQQINFLGQQALTSVGPIHHVYVAITPDGYKVNIDDTEEILEFNTDRTVPHQDLPLYLASLNERAADAELTNICVRSSDSELYTEGQRRVISPKMGPSPNIAVGFREGNGINKISKKSKAWVLDGQYVGGWPLSVELDGSEYGFKPNTPDSEVSISMRGNCKKTECDAFFAFGIGNNQYITFATDFDNGLLHNWGNGGTDIGLQIYPPCGGDVATGDASSLLTFAHSNPSLGDLRDALAGGDRGNMEILSTRRKSVNGDNWPITMEFVNNDITGKLTFRFASPTFKRGLICEYNSVATNEDFTLYVSPDWTVPGYEEKLAVRGFILYGNRFSRGTSMTMYANDDDDNEDVPFVEMEELYKADDNVFNISQNENKNINNYVMIFVGCFIFTIIMIAICLCKYYKGKNGKGLNGFSATENDPLLVNVQTKH